MKKCFLFILASVAPVTAVADPNVVAWGDSSNGQTNVPDGLNNVVAIAAGHTHSQALRADGTVVAWGKYWGDEYYERGRNHSKNGPDAAECWK